MPDKRGTFYEELAQEASKTLVETQFNIAFRQTLDKYKRGFLAGAKNGYTYGYIVLEFLLLGLHPIYYFLYYFDNERAVMNKS